MFINGHKHNRLKKNKIQFLLSFSFYIWVLIRQEQWKKQTLQLWAYVIIGSLNIFSCISPNMRLLLHKTEVIIDIYINDL